MRQRTRCNALTSATAGPWMGRDWQYGQVPQGYYGRPEGSAPIIQDLDEEALEDTLGRTGRSNPCLHTRRVHHKVPNSVFVDYFVPQQRFYEYTGPHAYTCSWGDKSMHVNHNCVVVNWPDLQPVVNQAVSAWYSSHNEVQGVLDAVEAPELITGLQGLVGSLSPGRLARTIRDCFRSLALYQRYYIASPLGRRAHYRLLEPKEMRRMMKAGTNLIGCLSSVWNAVASGFLYWSFAVAPLVSDIKKVQKALPNIQTMLGRVASRQPIRTTHRTAYGSFGRSLRLDASVGYKPTRSLADPGWWTSTHNIISAPKLIVTVRGTSGHNFSTALGRQLDYLLTRFGGAGPASFVWERIPFSFVGQWFVDINTLLGSLDSALTGGSKITDICVSRSYETLVNHIHVGNSTWVPGPGFDGWISGWTQLRYYQREPFSGSAELAFWAPRYGQRQGRLTAALLSQRLRTTVSSGN